MMMTKELEEIRGEILFPNATPVDLVDIGNTFIIDAIVQTPLEERQVLLYRAIQRLEIAVKLNEIALMERKTQNETKKVRRTYESPGMVSQSSCTRGDVDGNTC